MRSPLIFFILYIVGAGGVYRGRHTGPGRCHGRKTCGRFSSS